MKEATLVTRGGLCAGAPWLEELSLAKVWFVVRWKKQHHFLSQSGQEASLSQITRFITCKKYIYLVDEKETRAKNRRNFFTGAPCEHQSTSMGDRGAWAPRSVACGHQSSDHDGSPSMGNLLDLSKAMEN